MHIPDTKTKTERTFVIAGKVSSDIKFFFLNYQIGKCVRQAVGINKFGSIPKEIAKYLKLPEPEAYTGHCFRRSSATILVDAGGDLLALKRHGGWKSAAVAEGYIDDSIANKTATAQKICHSIDKPSTLTDKNKCFSYDIIINKEDTEVRNITENSLEDHLNKADNKVHQQEVDIRNMMQRAGAFTFNNCQNITINVNVHK